MDWLSEIEKTYSDTAKLEHAEFMFEILVIQRMARVLREFGNFMVGYVDEYWWEEGELSDDATELCVASRESSREE